MFHTSNAATINSIPIPLFTPRQTDFLLRKSTTLFSAGERMLKYGYYHPFVPLSGLMISLMISTARFGSKERDNDVVRRCATALFSFRQVPPYIYENINSQASSNKHVHTQI